MGYTLLLSRYRLCGLSVLVMFAGCERAATTSSKASRPAATAAEHLPGSPEPTAVPPPAAPNTTDAELSQIGLELARIEWFALGGVGIAGEQSRGERLALALAREPNAVQMFEVLATHPNRAARLYAYWALRTLHPEQARRHQQALASDPMRVGTMYGCVRTEQPTSEVAAEIEHSAPMPKPDTGHNVPDVPTAVAAPPQLPPSRPKLPPSRPKLSVPTIQDPVEKIDAQSDSI